MKRFFLVGLVGSIIVAGVVFAAVPKSRLAELKAVLTELLATRAKQKAAAAIVEKSFEGVQSLDIIALDPHFRSGLEDAPAKDTTERLESWKVTGKAVLTDPSEISKLKVALTKGIRESDLRPYKCFVPRHALRFQSGGSQVVMIICFECLQAEVSGIPNFEGALTSASPQKAFDEVFVAHGLTVAK